MVLARVKSRHPLSKKERKTLARELERLGQWAVRVVKDSSSLEVARVTVGGSEVVVYIADGRAAFIRGSDGSLEPCLLSMVRGFVDADIPKIIVDRGASLAVARGAKLMVPGIRRVEGDFKQGDIVVVVDEDSGVPIAIGKALMDSNEVRARLETGGRGPAVKPTQRPGDAFWKVCESLK